MKLKDLIISKQSISVQDNSEIYEKAGLISQAKLSKALANGYTYFTKNYLAERVFNVIDQNIEKQVLQQELEQSDGQLSADIFYFCHSTRGLSQGSGVYSKEKYKNIESMTEEHRKDFFEYQRVRKQERFNALKERLGWADIEAGFSSQCLAEISEHRSLPFALNNYCTDDRDLIIDHVVKKDIKRLFSGNYLYKIDEQGNEYSYDITIYSIAPENYAGVPPLECAMKMAKAKELDIFDSFELIDIVKEEKVESPINDPIIVGKIRNYPDRFFYITSWYKDVPLDQINNQNENYNQELLG